MNLKKKIGKLLTSKFVGTGPSYYEKRIYRAAVSQRLRNTGLDEDGRTKNTLSCSNRRYVHDDHQMMMMMMIIT